VSGGITAASLQLLQNQSGSSVAAAQALLAGLSVRTTSVVALPSNGQCSASCGGAESDSIVDIFNPCAGAFASDVQAPPEYYNRYKPFSMITAVMGQPLICQVRRKPMQCKSKFVDDYNHQPINVKYQPPWNAPRNSSILRCKSSEYDTSAHLGYMPTIKNGVPQYCVFLSEQTLLPMMDFEWMDDMQEEEVEVEVDLDAGEQGFAESFRDLVEEPSPERAEEVYPADYLDLTGMSASDVTPLELKCSITCDFPSQFSADQLIDFYYNLMGPDILGSAGTLIREKQMMRLRVRFVMSLFGVRASRVPAILACITKLQATCRMMMARKLVAKKLQYRSNLSVKIRRKVEGNRQGSKNAMLGSDHVPNDSVFSLWRLPAERHRMSMEPPEESPWLGPEPALGPLGAMASMPRAFIAGHPREDRRRARSDAGETRRQRAAGGVAHTCRPLMHSTSGLGHLAARAGEGVRESAEEEEEAIADEEEEEEASVSEEAWKPLLLPCRSPPPRSRRSLQRPQATPRGRCTAKAKELFEILDVDHVGKVDPKVFCDSDLANEVLAESLRTSLDLAHFLLLRYQLLLLGFSSKLCFSAADELGSHDLWLACGKVGLLVGEQDAASLLQDLGRQSGSAPSVALGPCRAEQAQGTGAMPVSILCQQLATWSTSAKRLQGWVLAPQAQRLSSTKKPGQMESLHQGQRVEAGQLGGCRQPSPPPAFVGKTPLEIVVLFKDPSTFPWHRLPEATCGRRFEELWQLAQQSGRSGGVADEAVRLLTDPSFDRR
ncbi:unnamed protein product, partial [Polarella glacialis]